MNNTEEQHPVFIPRNFIEKGTFMGGMFKIRNAIDHHSCYQSASDTDCQDYYSLYDCSSCCYDFFNWNRWGKHYCIFNERFAFSEKPPGYLPYGCASGTEKKVPD